jgi:hypothetical protein
VAEVLMPEGLGFAVMLKVGLLGKFSKTVHVQFAPNPGVSKLIGKIKEEGVLPQFEEILSKGQELKSAFVGFLNSINITIGSLMEVAAYSFLIPIIFDITAIAESSTNLRQSSLQIVERLLASGVIGLSGQALTVAIRKILKKLK